MSKKRFVLAIATIGILPCFLFASTSNTASLTDIKEALSLVIHMVEKQTAENNSSLAGMKSFEKRYQQENLISRIDVLEQKILFLEKKVNDSQKHNELSMTDKTEGVNLSKNGQEADKTITRFLKSKSNQ